MSKQIKNLRSRFPSRADSFRDDLDTRMLEAFSKQPPDLAPVQAIRAATKDALTAFGADDMRQIRDATALTLTVPEVRARAMDEFARTMEVIAEAIAKRADRSPSDLPVRALAGAVVGVIMSVTLPWSDWTSESATDDMFARIDEALALLESGLPL